MMKINTTTTILFGAAFVLSGCMADPASEAPMAADTMEATAPAMAVAPFVNRSLTTAEGTVFQFAPNGTVGGQIRGEAIVGTYESTATEICSRYSAPEFLTGRDYCSTPVITGNTVVFNRRDGSQSPVYTIEG